MVTDVISIQFLRDNQFNRLSGEHVAGGQAPLQMRMFSIWQAAFETACQWKIKPTRPMVSQIDKG